MKRFLLVALVSLFFVACNSNQKTAEKSESKDASVKSMTTAVDEKEKKTEELKKAPQLTIEQMRVLLPHELDSAKEKNYLASTQFGYGLASADYPKSKSRVIKVTLYDCAGEMGSVNYFENYWNKLNIQSQTENDFIRTVDFEGGKAVETYKKELNLSTFTFVVRERLVIVMEGKNISSEQLEEAAKKLHQKVA
jgi:hypothetical protein